MKMFELDTQMPPIVHNEMMRRKATYRPLKSDNSVAKIYYFISNGVKQEPLKLWRLVFIVLLIVLCTALTSTLWFTNAFWLTVRKFNVISNHSISFNYFEHLPVDRMSFCIYVYNYTNVDQYYARDLGSEEEEEDQLAVDYLGPYCFRESPEKRSLKFQDDNRRLAYKEATVFSFDAEASNGTLSDEVVVPNFPYLVVTSMGVDYNALFRLALATHIHTKRYQPFIRLNTSDFFFGYDDPLMDWVVGKASLLNIKVPFERFGLLDALLSFINVEVQVDTGVGDVTRAGKVTGFKGSSKMNFWKTSACNNYQGGEGTFWDVDKVQRGENIMFFASLLCRNIELNKIGEVDYEGSKVPRYEIIPDMFHKERAAFDCYCHNCTTNLLDMRQCLDGFPFKATFPKFYGLDPSHLTHLKNLPEPDPNDWSTIFDIHPYMGITLRFTQRMQLNLEIRKTSFLNLPPKIPNGAILPTVSMDRNIYDLRSDARTLLYHALTTLPVVEIVLKYLGVMFAIFLLYVVFLDLKRLCNQF
uniref:Scavenger receptor class B member 1 n=1 Tax=Cacopsylla melanoneura TaxID=428564 RepID=A0A8D8YV52_9HEMI